MYATLEDLLEQIAEADLIALIDDENTMAVDETVVDRAIANAQAVIDDHCESRYVIPFDPVPDSIRMYAVDLAIYNLYSRRPHIDIPEAIVERQKQAIIKLRQVQKREGSISGAKLATAGTENHSALIGGNDRIFTRDNMRGL